MSAVTGTWGELIWANTTSGTALASFTAEASLAAGIANLGTTSNFIQAGLPGGFFSLQPGGGIGKVIRIHLGGIFSSAAGTATFTFGLRWTTATGVLIATTTALTPATLTNELWDADIDFILTAAGPSTTATGRSWGKIVLENSAIATGTTITSPFITGSAFGTPTQTALTTAGFDSTVPLPIVPTCACSASSASNTVQLHDFKIYGLN